MVARVAAGAWLLVLSFAAAAYTAETRTIAGLAAGQHVKVEGRFGDAGPARVERMRARDGDGQIRIESQIVSLAERGQRLHLLGFTVDVPPSARILDGSIRLPDAGALRVGDRVEVRGTRALDGRLVANRVRRARLVGTPRDEIEAPIEAVLNRNTFDLLGRRMVLARGARFVDERTTARASTLRRDDDEQQVDGLTFGTWGTVGGRVETTYDDRGNLNLDGSLDRTRSVRSGLRIEASARLGARGQAYVKLDADDTYALNPGRRLPASLAVKEANVTVAVGGPFAVQVGRVRVRDEFEWYADDYVDAGRVLFTSGRTTAEVGASSGVGSPVEGRSRSDQRQWFGSLSHEFARAFEVSVHGLARDDRTRGEQPRWLFLQGHGRAGQLKYWGQAAVRRGRWQGGTLGGQAFDAGVSLHPFGAGPLLTASYAVASGDRHRSDTIDTTFRQTGLEDTETRAAGFKRLHTYGALLEPQLSNLRVFTVGVGQQWASASFDVLHHAYWQDVPRRSVSSSALAVRLTGAGGLLGEEVDALLTVRLRNGIDLSMVGGVYVPGAAQDGASKPAFFWRPQVQVFF